MSVCLVLLKETRADERRVALVPSDVELLIRQRRCSVLVENGAGIAAGFADVDYESAGATIVPSPTTQDECKSLFDRAQIVVRCKRPSSARHELERCACRRGLHLVAVIDVFANDAADYNRELRERGVVIHSIDQLENLARDDPMNLLAAMSRIAGRLALRDAWSEFSRRRDEQQHPNSIVVLGFGVCGESAVEEANVLCAETNLASVSITVVCASIRHQTPQVDRRYRFVKLDKSTSLLEQQSAVLQHIENADIVIACARNANQRAPLLIPERSLKRMKSGSVIIDLALTEGGNVERSKHDETVVVDGVVVKNVSGYPKQFPNSASIAWSNSTRLYIEKFLL